MNSSNYRFSLDIHSRQSQVSLPVMLNDTGRSLYISLSDGGEAYHIADGCLAVFVAKKSDEKTITNSCIIEGNTTIRYDFTAQTATAEGITNCEIRLYGADGRLITSPRFIMVVDERVLFGEDHYVSEDENTTFDTLVAELNALINQAKTTLANGGTGGGSSGSGEAGNGILEITKTDTEGLVDTYTIYYTNGSSSTFTVTNGKDGTDGAAYVLTDKDKQTIVDAVIAELPVYNGEVEEV